MSTNSMLNVLTPNGRIEFVLKQEIISRGMLIKRIGMENYQYYVELDEEVPKDGSMFYAGQIMISVTRVIISKDFFIQLLLNFLPEDKDKL